MLVDLLDRIADWTYGAAAKALPAVGRREAVILFAPPQGVGAMAIQRKIAWDYKITKCAIGYYGRVDDRHIFDMTVYARQRRQVARLLVTMGATLIDGDLRSLKPYVRGLPKRKR